nr:MAG TPA: hypothetical protein [Caudoviricetes sp.]
MTTKRLRKLPVTVWQSSRRYAKIHPIHLYHHIKRNR